MTKLATGTYISSSGGKAIVIVLITLCVLHRYVQISSLIAILWSKFQSYLPASVSSVIGQKKSSFDQLEVISTGS